MKVDELYKKQGFVVIKRVLTKEEVKSSSISLKNFKPKFKMKKKIYKWILSRIPQKILRQLSINISKLKEYQNFNYDYIDFDRYNNYFKKYN